jgi:hypothetical protein
MAFGHGARAGDPKCTGDPGRRRAQLQCRVPSWQKAGDNAQCQAKDDQDDDGLDQRKAALGG